MAELVEELRAREERYAAAFADLAAIRVALDQELAEIDAPLAGRARGGLLPADDRGLSMAAVRVQAAPFDLGAEASAPPGRARRDAGALVTFTGLVRDEAGTLEAHGDRALSRHDGKGDRRDRGRGGEPLEPRRALVIHRHGRLRPGEPIMMVATAAPHRADAFAAAEFLMDYLKSRAPFWKKEVTREGAGLGRGQGRGRGGFGALVTRPRALGMSSSCTSARKVGPTRP